MSCAQRAVENILRLGHFTYWEVRPDSPPFIIYLPRGITGRNSEIISNPISFYLLTERQTTNRNKDRDSILLNKDKPNLKKKNSSSHPGGKNAPTPKLAEVVKVLPQAILHHGDNIQS